MADNKPNLNLDSLLSAALEIDSPQQRAAFLAQSCGDDVSLRSEVERLLRSHPQAGGLLDEPAPELGAARLPTSADQERGAALEAGLAAAFPADAAVIMGDANHSVLKALGQTIDVPHVVLREAADESGDPVVRPQMADMPPRRSDSRYQLQGEIARGGMGAILKGRDTDLGRDLAIKVLLDEHKDRPDVVQRFVEEAQIGGQLQHPGIAPIYELGQFSDRRPFFSMKLVKGETLTKLLAHREDLSADRGKFLGIFEQICQTMAYAHSRGVIHRDLKPANIMVGAFGEVQVMDWGLAKVLPAGGVADEKAARKKQQGQSIIQTLRSGAGSDAPGTFGPHGSQTAMGSVMGTPAYMPPEQALGEIDHMDERADVFGLGAILCEILTGRPPYVGTDGTAVFRQASRGKLDDCMARLNACGADADLVALTKQCLELEPDDRPRDAGALAQRVSAHLESVETRLRQTEMDRAAEAARAEEALHTADEATAKARAERYARRLQVGLAAGFLLVATIGGIAAASSAMVQSRLKTDALIAQDKANTARVEESKQRMLAEEAKTRAEAEKARADITLADMQISRGLQAGQAGDAGVAALWFANAALSTPDAPDRQTGNRLRARNWLNEAIVPVALLKLPAGSLRRMSFQPGGALALTLNDRHLRIWDWRYEQPLRWSAFRRDVTDAVWSPDGKQLALATSAGEVQFVEPTTGSIRERFSAADQIAVVQWSPDGTRLAVGGKRAQVWNVTDTPARECDWPHPESVYGLTFNRSGTRLATACMDSQARVFATDDATRPAPLFAAVDHVPYQPVDRMPDICAPVFSDGDRKVVTILKSEQPGWWDVETGRSEPPIWKQEFPENKFSLVTSPDGRWTAASSSRSCLLWSVEGKSFEFKHPNHVAHTAFHPDGQSMLTTCWDGTARLWPLTSADSSPRTVPQMATFADCIFSRDGAVAAIAGRRQVVVWQLPQQTMIVGQVAAWTDSFRRPRASFDGRLTTLGAPHESAGILTAASNVLSVARMPSGELAGPKIALAGELWDSCICSDNRSVASLQVSGATGLLAVFDVATGTPAFEPLDLPSLPQSVAARPGHPQIAVLCRDGKLLVIDSEDGSLELELTHKDWKDNSRYARVEYSPDGASLVSTTPQNYVFVRDAEAGELRFPSWSPVLEGGPLRTIAFSPDSRFLATGVNGENAVQVWDLATGQAAAPPLPHPGDYWGIFSVAFSPDGRRVLSGHKDGLLRLWDWKSGSLVVPPMQHPDEVYDGKFTPDGRYAVTAVRNSTVHVWDLACGKLAAPPLRYPLAEESRNTLCVSGWRVITSAPPSYLVVDLSILLKDPETDIEALQRRAQLATNLRLQLGETATLQQSEWNERWEAYVASRITPDEEAQSLARALDEAADDAEREIIGRRALRTNLLDRLLALRPDVLPLHVLSADHRAGAGDPVGASRQRKVAIATIESSRGERISNPSASSLLARLLVDESEASSFAPLTPLEMKAAAGTRLTLRSDGSILASQEPQQNETYTVTARTPARRMAALRLETLTDASIDGLGPGWGGSNFHLTGVSAELLRPGQSPVPLRFRTAIADYTRSATDGGGPNDGPLAAIDGDPTTLWDIWPQSGEPHWLLLPFAESIDLEDDDRLVVQLAFQDSRWPRAKLGCFRLSIAEGESDIAKLQLAHAVRKASLSGADALAAAYLTTGNTDRATELLQPAAEGDDTPVRLMLRAIAQRSLGDLAAVRQTAEKLVAMDVQPPPRALRELCCDIVIESLEEALPATVRRSPRGTPFQFALARRLKDRGEKVAEEPAAAIAKLKQSQEIFAWLLRDPQWQTLKPTEIKSQFGATLALQPDGSILASGTNPEQEVYTVAAQPGLASITAVRLETLPHTSLPGGGSGRDPNGSFCLNELTVSAGRSSSPWRFQSAVASFHRKNDDGLQYPIQLAVDELPWTRWDAWPEVYQRQEAVFEMTPNPADLTAATLVIQLHSDSAGGLGRFRLSVTDEPGAAQRAATRMDAVQNGEIVDLSVALAKAHMRLGQFDEAVAAFGEALDLAPDRTSKTRVITEAAPLNGALDNLAERLDDDTLFPELGRQFARQGRWRESANNYLQAVKLDPAIHRPWGVAASALLMAGDIEGYRQHCRAMLKQFHGTNDTSVADVVCKNSLLLADAVDVAELPTPVVRAKAGESGLTDRYRSWFMACNALISYREGKPADALDWTGKMPSMAREPGALGLLIRAMSEEKLGRHEQAVKSLAEAEALIPVELRTLGAADYAVPLPVPGASIEHDWLVAEILRREAEALIDGARDENSDSGQTRR